MKKAHTLKPESALEFKDTLNGQRNDLLFMGEYIYGLHEEIDRFENKMSRIGAS